MMSYIYVAIGSAIGGTLRYATSITALHYLGSSFPFGTLIVNICGSFIIGLCAGFLGGGVEPIQERNIKHFMMIGVCGGFTTFSSFSLETLQLIENAEIVKAGVNVILSVILCIVATWLGYFLSKIILKLKGV
ncbi:MAG: fluoride efflux transporter CrcB [Pseudomonadota bacterium]